MHVCCYRRFASLDSTASWRGCPMQSNATVELSEKPMSRDTEEAGFEEESVYGFDI